MNLLKDDAPVKALFDLVGSVADELQEVKRVAHELLPFIRSKGEGELAAIVTNSIKFFDKQCEAETLGKMFAADGALLHCHLNTLKGILRWWVINNHSK
jgi:hypothetical protein